MFYSKCLEIILLGLLSPTLFYRPSLQDTLSCGSSSKNFQVSFDPEPPVDGAGNSPWPNSVEGVGPSSAKYTFAQFEQLFPLALNVCSLTSQIPRFSPLELPSKLVITKCDDCSKCIEKLATIHRVLTQIAIDSGLKSLLVMVGKGENLSRYVDIREYQNTITKFIFMDIDKGKPFTSSLCELTDVMDTDSLKNFSKTSVLFVSISFIILMAISLAWLIFYYVQRFRYAHAKDRLQRRLFNAAKKALTGIPTRPIKAFGYNISVRARNRIQFSADESGSGTQGSIDAQSSTSESNQFPYTIVNETHDPFRFNVPTSSQFVRAVQTVPIYIGDSGQSPPSVSNYRGSIRLSLEENRNTYSQPLEDLGKGSKTPLPDLDMSDAKDGEKICQLSGQPDSVEKKKLAGDPGEHSKTIPSPNIPLECHMVEDFIVIGRQERRSLDNDLIAKEQDLSAKLFQTPNSVEWTKVLYNKHCGLKRRLSMSEHYPTTVMNSTSTVYTGQEELRRSLKTQQQSYTRSTNTASSD